MADSHPFDDPKILAVLFHPRKAQAGSSHRPNTTDGTIPTGDEAELGYRLFRAEPASSLIVFFHGNGEVARDYGRIAPLYGELGLSLLVVDYRGYGWSTGKPLASTLLTDALAVADGLVTVREKAGIEAEVPLYIMGRSLGSVPAIHLAHERGGGFAGLIVESGFADTTALLLRIGAPPDRLQPGTADPFDNAGKMASIHLPLLVIHGTEDLLIPISEGETLYNASPSTQKVFFPIRGAGHNDLLSVDPEGYFQAIDNFITAAL